MLQLPSQQELAALAAQPPAVTVATPINDIQLVVLAAATLFKANAGVTSPKQAVEEARHIFVEAVVAERRQSLRATIDQRLTQTERTAAGEQFVIPGTR